MLIKAGNVDVESLMPMRLHFWNTVSAIMIHA